MYDGLLFIMRECNMRASPSTNSQKSFKFPDAKICSSSGCDDWDRFETSTLSLKSLEKQRSEIDHKAVDDEIYDEKNISLEDIIEIWDEYAKIQEDKGKYNLASILRISTPSFEKNTIIYTVPNNTTSLEIDLEKQQLLLFFRTKLKSKIDLTVSVDKKIENKKAYTNKEKFMLLKKKNPLIDNLKNEFKLSI